MTPSLAGALDLVLADLPAEFLSPRDADALRAAAANLPPLLRGGFELHLAPEAPGVDLQQCVRRANREPEIAAAFIEARAAQGGVDPSWLRVRDFCRTWLARHERVRELWLEIDAGEAVAAPAIFAALHSPDRERFDPTALIQSLVVDFMDAPLDSPLQRKIASCVAACRDSEAVTHVGAMLSRRPAVVRLNVARLAPAAVVPYLQRLDWEGPLHEVEALTAEILPQAQRFSLCLDVGEVLSPRLGFECVLPVDAEWRTGWPVFLDRFVALGRCTAAQRDALRRWSGLLLPWQTSRSWPPELVVESLLHAPDRVSAIDRRLSHLKVDYRPGRPLTVKAYLWFAHRWLRPGAAPDEFELPASDPRTATPRDARGYRAQVRAYYDRTNAEYLEHVGPTFQADLVAAAAPSDDAAASNRQLAAWAGIAPGQRVLDAGCGVAGPALDIAAAIEGVTIEGITISPAQARTARARIAAAGLSQRVRVCIGDYHDLPYPGAAFDVVVFFESSGYSDDREQLFREVRRVLRPGGALYIKDAFRVDGPLTDADRDGLAAFDRTYAHRTPGLAGTIGLLERAGFVAVRSRDLRPYADRRRWTRAMGDVGGAIHELTPFGELHFRGYPGLAVYPAEIRARAPR